MHPSYSNMTTKNSSNKIILSIPSTSSPLYQQLHNFINFAPDVYLVTGATRHCIYDLNKGNLYSISDNLRKIIISAMKNKNAIKKMNDCDTSMLTKLIETGLLVTSTSKQKPLNILTLQRSYLPTFAWIEVTKQCNLRCSFCYEESSAKCNEKMSLANFKLVKDELIKLGIKNIQFIGGEPLILGETLKKMIVLCGNDFLSIEVFSNGTLLNPEWCEFFKRHNINVAISIHSYRSKDHDKVTNCKGSHTKVLNAARLLQQYKIPYRVAAVRTKNCNIGKPTKRTFYKVRPDDVRLTGRGEFSQYNYQMFKRKAITKKTMQSRMNRNVVIQNISGQRCFLKNIYIDCNLEVFPCVMERRFSHGFLSSQKSLQDILNPKILHLSKDHIKICKDCEYRYVCMECRPDSNGASKLAKPWYCTYDPYKGEWLDIKTVYNSLVKES